MKLEKIIKRDDGKRVQISVSLRTDSYRDEFSYEVSVLVCAPRKRTWVSVYDSNSWEYRKMNPDQKRQHIKGKQLEHASESEIFDAKLSLWNNFKPEPPQP